MKWTDVQIRELKRLASSGKYFKTEIADRMGLKPVQINHKIRKDRVNYVAPEGRFGAWNRKHAHLREAALTYFLTHTWEETRKHFGLTRSELKSMFTAAYRDPKLAHLRKETRTHAPWKSNEWKFMAAHCGLISRKEIARLLGRSRIGKHHAVKDRLRGLSGSRYLNGLTSTLAHELLPDVAFISILTRAGSPGCGGNTQARIVPWVMLEDLTRGRRMDSTIRSGIRAMARFQRWVHGAKSNGEAMEAVMKILNGEKRKR